MTQLTVFIVSPREELSVTLLALNVDHRLRLRMSKGFGLIVTTPARIALAVTSHIEFTLINGKIIDGLL